MKKTKFILAIIMCCMVIVSCGDSKKNDISNEINELRDQYNQAINNHNFEAAYELASKIDALAANEIANDRMNLNDKDFEAKYGFSKLMSKGIKFNGTEDVYEQEVKFLTVQGTSEANNRLLLLILDKYPTKGIARSEGEKLADEKPNSLCKIESMKYLDDEYYAYWKYCNDINAKCMQILDVAITLDNKELAKLMIETIKPNPDIKTNFIKKVQEVNYYDLYAHYTTKTLEEAKAKFEKKFGKFEE